MNSAGKPTKRTREGDRNQREGDRNKRAALRGRRFIPVVGGNRTLKVEEMPILLFLAHMHGTIATSSSGCTKEEKKWLCDTLAQAKNLYHASLDEEELYTKLGKGCDDFKNYAHPVVAQSKLKQYIVSQSGSKESCIKTMRERLVDLIHKLWEYATSIPKPVVSSIMFETFSHSISLYSSPDLAGVFLRILTLLQSKMTLLTEHEHSVCIALALFLHGKAWVWVNERSFGRLVAQMYKPGDDVIKEKLRRQSTVVGVFDVLVPPPV